MHPKDEKRVKKYGRGYVHALVFVYFTPTCRHFIFFSIRGAFYVKLYFIVPPQKTAYITIKCQFTFLTFACTHMCVLISIQKGPCSTSWICAWPRLKEKKKNKKSLEREFRILAFIQWTNKANKLIIRWNTKPQCHHMHITHFIHHQTILMNCNHKIKGKMIQYK